MTIKELQNHKDYYFRCDIKRNKVLKEIDDMDCFDEWGCAFASIGDEVSVEYNLCIDNTTDESIDESAIYKVDYDADSDTIETDYDKYIHYEIDFNNRNWKKELENAMCEAMIEFFEL